MNIVRGHIYERFTQNSDPIKDMNIGSRPYLRKIWNTEFQKIGKQNPYKTYQRLFSDKKEDRKYINAIVMGIYITLEKLCEESIKNDNHAYKLGIAYLRIHNYIKRIGS